MEPRDEPAPYVDVEICFRADPKLRAVVRSVAVEASHADQAYGNAVRLATDTLVCALLACAREDAQLCCLFRTLDGEVRIQASLPDAQTTAPEAKARSAALLDQLDLPVSMFTVGNDANSTELVCETVVSRSRHNR